MWLLLLGVGYVVYWLLKINLQFFYSPINGGGGGHGPFVPPPPPQSMPVHMDIDKNICLWILFLLPDISLQ